MRHAARLLTAVAAAIMLLGMAGNASAGINQWTTNGPYGGNIQTIALSPDYASNQTVYAGTRNGVFKSTDGGTNWAAVRTGIPNLDIRSLAISPNYATDQTVYAGTVYSGTYGGGVYKTTNGGTSWTIVNTGITADSYGHTDVSSLAISPNYATDQTVYAGTSARGVFKTTNGGTSWTAVNTGINDLHIDSLAISPNYAIDHTAYAGSYSGVFKSTNCGTSWTSVNTGITGTNINPLAISPSYAADQTVYAVTSCSGGGLFKSTNGGTSWTALNTGITNLSILSLALSPNFATDQTVYAGTYGDGVFKSTDGGASWTAVNTGLTNTFIYSLAVAPNYATDQTVYAGTWGSGVFSYTSDMLPPSSTITAPEKGANLTGTSFTITGTSDDGAGSGIQKVEVGITPDGGATTWYNATGTASWSYGWALPVNGGYTIMSRATDNGDNVETPGAGVSVTVSVPVSLTSLNPTLPSPCTVNNTVEWFATATGGSGSYEYKFMLRDPAGVWTTVKDYAVPGNTWNWKPTVGGKYQVLCYVRNAGTTTKYDAYLNSGFYYVNYPAAQMVSITPSTPSPSIVNNLVTWTGVATGGSGSYEYKFMLRDPAGVWTTPQGYSVSNSWNWTTGAPGKYLINCSVRNAGTTVKSDSTLNSSWYYVQ